MRRKFIWHDGKRLSLDQVKQRLHRKRPVMPVELIEQSVLEWLDQASLPDDLIDGDQEQQWIEHIEAWIEAHQQHLENP